MRLENIRYSLIRYFIDEHELNTILLFDGAEYPNEKPFMTVQQQQNNTSVLSKQRDGVQTIYRFQVGIFAEHSPQLAQLQEQVSRGLLFDRIPLYDATNPGGPSAGVFIVDGNLPFVPIPAEDVSDQTKFHRGYFDVAVHVTFNAATPN